MAWGAGKAGCGAAWLVAVLVCPALALSQMASLRSPRASSSSLPDAPSASLTPSVVVQDPAFRLQTAPAGVVLLAQNGSQSWWLVSPENAPYRPLSPREKFQSFVHHTFSPYTFASAAYDATWGQAWGDPKQWGGGMEGWGKRLGAAAASTESRSFFGSFLFPALLHQDPRYFAMGKGSVKDRVLHAMKRVVVTRKDDGSDTLNSSGLLAIAFTESLSMAWTPEVKRTPGTAANCVLGALQGEATSNLLREFTPDILRIFKRHAPKSLKRIEERLPATITGDTGQP